MIIDDPTALYRQPLRGGIYRLPESALSNDPGKLAERLTAAGWHTTVLGPIADLNGFYTEIAAGLDFPHYFGANLDALWDALKQIRTPTAVIIDWQGFATADPDRAARVLAVLDQRSDLGPPFAAILS